MAIGFRHQDLAEPAADARPDEQGRLQRRKPLPAEGERQQRSRRRRQREPEHDGGRPLGMDEAAHQDHGDGGYGGRKQHGDDAEQLLVAQPLRGSQKRQLRPGDDEHAGKADHHSAPAVEADRLAQEHGAEHHHQQRLRIVQRDRLGQRQAREREEAERHGRDAHQPARYVAERPRRRQRAVQHLPPRQEQQDGRNGEEGAEEDDLTRRHVAGGLDECLHGNENRHRQHLHAYAGERIPRNCRRRHAMAVLCIASHMRAGVAGISIWPIP